MKLQDEGAQLKDQEIVSNLIGLLVGGNLTTSDLIGNGVYALLTHPEQLAKLKADPGIVGQVVEEILRYDGPVDITARVTPREMEVARMVADGLPSKHVADRLSITEGTAKLHLHHVYLKLRLGGRVALVRYMQRHALE